MAEKQCKEIFDRKKSFDSRGPFIPKFDHRGSVYSASAIEVSLYYRSTMGYGLDFTPNSSKNIFQKFFPETTPPLSIKNLETSTVDKKIRIFSKNHLKITLNRVYCFLRLFRSPDCIFLFPQNLFEFQRPCR